MTANGRHYERVNMLIAAVAEPGHAIAILCPVHYLAFPLELLVIRHAHVAHVSDAHLG